MNSIIFFPLFLAFSSSYALIGKKYGNYNKNLLILMLVVIYTFILGVRVNFGTDQIAYLHMYYYQGADLLRCEKLFVALNIFLRSLNAPYQALFSIIAFIEIYLLVLIFEKENVSVFYGYVLFFLLYLNINLNLSRQAMAMGFVLFSITFFSQKKYLSWLILCLIAVGFHASAFFTLLIVPLVALLKNIKTPRFVFYILIFLFSMFFEQIFDIILNIFLLPLNAIFGNKVQILQKILTMKIPLGSGMGIRLRGAAYIFMLPLMLDYKKLNDKNNLYFSLMYFGVLGEFIASINMNLSRIFYYFSEVQLIVIPAILSHISVSNLKKAKIKELLFIFGIFLVFVLAISKWLSGADTTEFYKMNLNFNLFENHTF